MPPLGHATIQIPDGDLLPPPVAAAADTYRRLQTERADARKRQTTLQRKVTTSERDARQAAAASLLAGDDPDPDDTTQQAADELDAVTARLSALDQAIGMAEAALADAVTDTRPSWADDLTDRIEDVRDTYRATASKLVDQFDTYRTLAHAAAWLDRFPHKPVLTVPPAGWNRAVNTPALISELLAATEPPEFTYDDPPAPAPPTARLLGGVEM